MGQFSFITSDTGKRIVNYNRHTYYLITEGHEVYTEHDYEGYGVFDDMDIYALIGYLNGYVGEEKEVREKVFNELLNGGITNGKKTYKYGVDFKHYEQPIEAEGGSTANQLLQEKGFKKVFPKFEFSEFAKAGIIVPKIVEHLPKEHFLMKDEEWKKYFRSLPHTKGDPKQGF